MDMKISTRGRYALRMMLDFAIHDIGGYISLRDVAGREDISVKYMEQIVGLLSRAGLLESVRGAQGGYRLAQSAEDCTVGDILYATEKSLAPVSCLTAQEEQCPREDSCTTHPFWAGLQETIQDYVDSVTLADLAGR